MDIYLDRDLKNPKFAAYKSDATVNRVVAEIRREMPQNTQPVKITSKSDPVMTRRLLQSRKKGSASKKAAAKKATSNNTTTKKAYSRTPYTGNTKNNGPKNGFNMINSNKNGSNTNNNGSNTNNNNRTNVSVKVRRNNM